MSLLVREQFLATGSGRIPRIGIPANLAGNKVLGRGMLDRNIPPVLTSGCLCRLLGFGVRLFLDF